MNYYLLIYNTRTNELVVQEPPGDATSAATAYTEREHEHRGQHEIEVVLVGADSLETIKRTHSHYFSGPPDTFLKQIERELTTA